MESPPLPAASQASSHFTLDPIPASVLADKEARRRDAAAVQLGYCMTGCAVLDDDVLLLGGFERGSVVGVSAEDEEMGVQLGLQTLAHSLCDGRVAKGLVVTPKPRNVMLARLKDAVKAELKSQGGVSGDAAKTKLRECLDKVMLSCVFDLDGLWEVLADLNKPVEEEDEEEIQDSQDDDDEALSPGDNNNNNNNNKRQQMTQPGIIVVTHFSSLLTGVFTHRERSAAHSAMQLLGSHLRDLSRNLSSSPLIMLLNSTSSSSSSSGPPPTGQTKNNAPLDATLRSIFHTPPPPQPGQGSHSSTRRVKPNYGVVFSQLLDLHLLCTRIPRTMKDAEAAVQRLGEEVRMVWVVEVLQDEIGVWEGTRGARKGREQLWTVVDVEQARVKPAFG